MRHTLLLILSLCALRSATAQTFNDALRYSQFQWQGTARFMGVSGAMNALGADFSTASTNPAGMAMFRKSELMITPGFNTVRTTSVLQGTGNQALDEGSNKFVLNNIGIVISGTPSGSRWKTINFGVGLNRLNAYNQEFFFEGNSQGTIIDRFTALADGLAPDQLDDFEAGLAYDVGAIYSPDAANLYANDFQGTPNAVISRRQLSEQSGYANELNFSLAANYDEKLMIGASVGVPFYNFSYSKYYAESDPTDAVPAFNRLEYAEFLNASGSAVNFKLGLIYRPIQLLRIGLALHTPTFSRITENYSNKLTYEFNEGSGNQTFSAESPNGSFEYRLQTPWRFMGGLGVLLGQYGFIGADVEYVDYSTNNFKFRSTSIGDKAYERSLNTSVRDRLHGALNFRTGIELVRDIWRVRGGFTLDGSPFAGDRSFQPGWSLGAGFRENSFFLDLAFVRRQSDALYNPYAVANAAQQQVSQTLRNSQVVLTLGFKL